MEPAGIMTGLLAQNSNSIQLEAFPATDRRPLFPLEIASPRRFDRGDWDPFDPRNNRGLTRARET